MSSVTIHRRFIRQSPRKLQLVARLIAQKPIAWATGQLTVLPKRAAKEVLKALKSASAAANQQNLSLENLVISRINVGQGPALKRTMPGPRGRTYRIKKMLSHITITLGDNVSLVTKRSLKNRNSQPRGKKSETRNTKFEIISNAQISKS